jgi:DNA-3-methyladenine glycosylase
LIRRLKRSELPTDTAALARYLIGKILVHETPRGRLSGRIVETEAYELGDAAAHSFRGMTARNRSLFLDRGHSYVYFIYGTWWAMNVSAETEGVGGGVLLRALEPLDGIKLMQRRRPRSTFEDLARGPGRLATAFGIDRKLDGLDLCKKGPLWLGAETDRDHDIGVSPRIGITHEAHRLLRFYVRNSPFVSGLKRLRS